ncbi:MAG: hypothetical protein ACRBFS_20745 [Aureispira sp.]
MVAPRWTTRERFLLYVGMVFTLLFVGTTLGPLQWIPSLRPWLNHSAELAVQWSARVFLGQADDFYSPISSDALGLLIHCFNLLIVALSLGLLLLFRTPREGELDQWYYGLRTFLSYYIALQLLLYGFNKVFKYQFYLPEPNTLYTTVGETPRDLLFWSLMGTAYGYTVFAGLLEVLAALLLLFRKTRLVGALLAMVVLTHVVAVNFGFNISVKVYSLFYLCFTGVILLPHIRRLYAFLINNQWMPTIDWQPSYKKMPVRVAYASLKTVVVGLLLLESLYPYFQVNNFNDDSRARPAFHGAYQVESFVRNDRSYPDRSIYPDRWQRAFVHRRGYFIVQYMNNKTQDYQLAYDQENGVFEFIHTQTQQRSVVDYDQLSDGSLRLTGVVDGERLEVFLKKLDWQSLPLLQEEFHWIIDQINPR